MVWTVSAGQLVYAFESARCCVLVIKNLSFDLITFFVSTLKRCYGQEILKSDLDSLSHKMGLEFFNGK